MKSTLESINKLKDDIVNYKDPYASSYEDDDPSYAPQEQKKAKQIEFLKEATSQLVTAVKDPQEASMEKFASCMAEQIKSVPEKQSISKRILNAADTGASF